MILLEKWWWRWWWGVGTSGRMRECGRGVGCVCEKMKKKKWRGPLSWLARRLIMWDDFCVVGKHIGWVSDIGSQKSDPTPFLFFFSFFFLSKGLGCYEISLGHSRTLSTWPHHKLPHGMILPNYINISLGHSRNLDTWPHHRLPHGMILIF